MSFLLATDWLHEADHFSPFFGFFPVASSWCQSASRLPPAERYRLAQEPLGGKPCRL
jgi:hypothetical protein